MIITLKEAFKILSNCSAIIVDKDVLVYPALDEEGVENDNYDFMEINWENDNCGYKVTFSRTNNEEIEVKCDSMILKDENNIECSIQILQPVDIETQFLIENFG